MKAVRFKNGTPPQLHHGQYELGLTQSLPHTDIGYGNTLLHIKKVGSLQCLRSMGGRSFGDPHLPATGILRGAFNEQFSFSFSLSF